MPETWNCSTRKKKYNSLFTDGKLFRQSVESVSPLNNDVHPFQALLDMRELKKKEKPRVDSDSDSEINIAKPRKAPMKKAAKPSVPRVDSDSEEETVKSMTRSRTVRRISSSKDEGSDVEMRSHPIVASPIDADSGPTEEKKLKLSDGDSTSTLES